MKNSKFLKLLILILSLLAIGVVSFETTFYLYERYSIVKKPYLYINGEGISRLEYNYYFNSVYNSYLNEMGNYMDYLGVDPNQNLLDQMHDEERTFSQYFDECTKELLKKNYALWDEGHAKGFACDTDAAYNEYIDSVSSSVGEDKVNDYLEETYGPYADKRSLRPFFERDFYCTRYYSKLQQDMNRDEYDTSAFDYVESLKDGYEITYN